MENDGSLLSVKSKRGAQVALSTIYTLSEDVIWHIFVIIATSEDPLTHPLNNTRRASQVCHIWRHLLLGSSTIWGKLMDWRSLNQKAGHWRFEVLRRSGTSPLWIRGNTSLNNSPPTQEMFGQDVKGPGITFFYHLISEHWERIERVYPFIVSVERIQSVQIGALQSKAPNMQDFSLPLCYVAKNTDQCTMFFNYAPKLRAFSATIGICKLNRAWMSGLETLCLGGMFNSEEICRVLVDLPNLKSLRLQRHMISTKYEMPPMHLPNLRKLELDECIYLRRIVYPPACSLILRVWNQRPIDSFPECGDNIMATMLHKLSLFQTPPKFMALNFQRFFKLRISNDAIPYGKPTGALFDIQLSLGRIALQETLRPGFLHRLSIPVFSKVVTLLLRWGEGANEAFESAYVLRRLLSFFPSVEKLCMSAKDIETLLNQNQIIQMRIEPLIFANLRTLEVLSLDFGFNANEVQRFLIWRRSIGAQIAILDLTRCRVSITQQDLIVFDEFLGLKIIWKQDGYPAGYYECGSMH